MKFSAVLLCSFFLIALSLCTSPDAYGASSNKIKKTSSELKKSAHHKGENKSLKKAPKHKKKKEAKNIKKKTAPKKGKKSKLEKKKTNKPKMQKRKAKRLERRAKARMEREARHRPVVRKMMNRALQPTPEQPVPYSHPVLDMALKNIPLPPSRLVE